VGDKQHELGLHEPEGAPGGPGSVGGGDGDRIPLGTAWGERGAAEEVTRGGGGGSHSDEEQQEEAGPLVGVTAAAGDRHRRGRRGFRHRRQDRNRVR
jgi:hypothetical protein